MNKNNNQNTARKQGRKRPQIHRKRGKRERDKKR